MSTKTEERIDEMRDRIDRLEARARADGGRAGESMQGRVEALRRQEASARAAVREHSPAAGLKVRLLEARLKTAEHGLAAELAENREDFIESMDAYVDDYWELNHALKETRREQARGGTRAGRAEPSRPAARQGHGCRASRREPREGRRPSGARSKRSVGAARAELERKVDDAMKKFE